MVSELTLIIISLALIVSRMHPMMSHGIQAQLKMGNKFQPICLRYPCIEDITRVSAVEEEALGMELEAFLPILFFEPIVV